MNMSRCLPESWEHTGLVVVHRQPGYGPAAQAKSSSAPGEASTAARVLPGAWWYSRLAHSCLHPPEPHHSQPTEDMGLRVAPRPGEHPHPSPRSSWPAWALEHPVLRMFLHAVGSLNSSRPVRCSDTLCWFFLVLGLAHMVKTDQPCSSLNSVLPSPLTKKAYECRTHQTLFCLP